MDEKLHDKRAMVKRPRLFLAGVIAVVIPWLAAGVHAADDLPTVLERAMPAVVHVESESTVMVRPRRFPRGPFFERFLPQPQQGQRRGGTGSGVIINAAEGHIITNHHVIAGADSIVIALSDGRRYEARVLGVDPETDIAVLQIDADNLTEIPAGDSNKLRVGEAVYAIGSPFGLSQTVTSGIVSALSRSGLGIESYEDFIQTDAAINKGNSGGALINARGELVGINTAILGAAGGGNIGIGFAIPFEMVSAVTGQLLESGRVQRGQLGITVQVLTPDLAKAFGVDRRRGIIVVQVQPDSAAEEAGLAVGDILVAVNGRPVENHHQIRSYIGLRRVGEKVSMKVLREGEELEVEAVIAARELRDLAGDNLGPKFAGLFLENIVAGDGEARGVVVKSIRKTGHAYRKGLRTGDVIVAVNRRPVGDIEGLSEIVDEAGDSLVLLVKRRGRSIFIAL